MVFMWIHRSEEITNHKPDYQVECLKRVNMEESRIDNSQGVNKIILKKNQELTL